MSLAALVNDLRERCLGVTETGGAGGAADFRAAAGALELNVDDVDEASEFSPESTAVCEGGGTSPPPPRDERVDLPPLDATEGRMISPGSRNLLPFVFIYNNDIIFIYASIYIINTLICIIKKETSSMSMSSGCMM